MGQARRFLKICLTGGPSAGKTSVIDILKREFSEDALCAPEAASILYRGGFPRSHDSNAIRAAQRAIYRIQVEMESILESSMKQPLMICDRGTLDHPAYWPLDSTMSFFEAVNSSLQNEIDRYDFVIHLQTSRHDYGQDAVRIESLEEALELDARIEAAWRAHPRRIQISSQLHFHQKLDQVFQAIESCLKQRNLRSRFSLDEVAAL